jgi:tRNA pseudouridine55 synthase
VQVERIEIVEFAYPHLALEIECGSGTYVRAIGRDLGRAVGSGAVMTELRRVRIGVFGVESGLRCEELSREVIEGGLLPASLAVAGRACCTVADEGVVRLRQGRDVPLPPAEAWSQFPTDESPALVGVLDGDGHLVAVAEQVGSRLVPRQVFAGTCANS